MRGKMRCYFRRENRCAVPQMLPRLPPRRHIPFDITHHFRAHAAEQRTRDADIEFDAAPVSSRRRTARLFKTDITPEEDAVSIILRYYAAGR